MKSMFRHGRGLAFVTGSALALAACAAVSAQTAPPSDAAMADTAGPTGTAATVAYGTVRSIDTLDKDVKRGTGAILGGIIGAVIGRSIGDSSAEKNVGTAIGAAAGAIIGHEIEKSVRGSGETGGVRITVTLDDGSTRRFDFREAGGLRVGDRVRIEGSNLFKIA